MLGRMFGLARNVHYDQGIRLFDQGQYEEAIAELTLAASSGGGDILTQRLTSFYIAESYANLGTAALHRHDFTVAQKALCAALEINPQYADLHCQYGVACREASDPNRAKMAFRNALEINDRFARAHLLLGLCLYEDGDTEEALFHIRQAVTLDAGYDGPALEKALAAHESGDVEDAKTHFALVLNTDVDDIVYYTELGTDFYRRGLYTQAAEEFRKALNLNPDYADLRNR
jgi:tetratricopeptide (TPR) repeat protein